MRIRESYINLRKEVRICARPAVVLLVSVEQKLSTESAKDAKNLLTPVLANRNRNNPSKTKQVRGISEGSLMPLHVLTVEALFI